MSYLRKTWTTLKARLASVLWHGKERSVQSTKLLARQIPSNEEMLRDFLSVMEDVDANFEAVFG